MAKPVQVQRQAGETRPQLRFDKFPDSWPAVCLHHEGRSLVPGSGDQTLTLRVNMLSTATSAPR